MTQPPAKRSTILFSIYAKNVDTETWERFKDTARANGHTLAGLFTAFVRAYIRRGIGDAEQDYRS